MGISPMHFFGLAHGQRQDDKLFDPLFSSTPGVAQVHAEKVSRHAKSPLCDVLALPGTAMR